MALIGVRFPRYCPYTVTTSQDGTESEEFGTGKVMGKAMSVNVTINAEPQYQYADDGVAETVTEFTGGTIANELNDMIDSVEAELLGKSTVDGMIQSKSDDNAPYVRVGFIEPHMLNNKRQFKVQIYTRVKYSPPGKSLTTKGQTVTFAGVTINGALMRDASGVWEKHQTFETIEGAVACLNEQMYMSSADPEELTMTSVPAENATSVSTTADIKLTFSNPIDHGGVSLIKASTGEGIPATKTFDSTKKILTINPKSSLSASTAYFVVTAGIVDAYNQQLEDQSVKFTTK